MNYYVKVIFLTLMLLAVIFSCFAVESTLTLRGGMSGAQTDITKDKVYSGMLGLSYEVWMARWISLGIYPYITRAEAGPDAPGRNFSTNLAGGDLLLKLRPHWTVIAPYIAGGAGIVNFFPKTKEGHRIVGVTDPNFDYTVAVAPTLGAGFDIFTGKGIDFTIGAQKNFMQSDYLEGRKGADDNDSYWMAYLGVSHTFGKVKEVEFVPPPVIEEPIPEVKIIPQLKVTPTSQNVDPESGNTDFQVNSNIGWTATEYEDWLSVNPTSGTGNASFMVNYDENTAYTPRTGYIQVSGEGLSQTLTVMQEGKTMPPLALNNVHFEFNKYNLTDEAMSILDADVAILAYYPDAMLDIRGYTDIIGGENYNLRLSDHRALTVKDYLVSKGISADRLTVSYFGKADPVAPNDTEEGRAQNRRVELVVK